MAKDGVDSVEAREDRDASGRHRDEGALCDACGSAMKPMGHCKYVRLRCGFLRTCNDVI